MLINHFKSSYILQYAMLFLFAFILWLPAFISPPEIIQPLQNRASPFFPVWLILFGQNSFLLTMGTFLMVYMTALFANLILEKNDLIPRNTLLAAFFFILLVSHVNFDPQNPGYIVIIFLLAVLWFTLSIYRIPEPNKEVFNAGLSLGIVSFFYFPAISFLFFVWITFIVYRLYLWRIWLILVIGILTFLSLAWTYYFLVDELNTALNDYKVYFLAIRVTEINIDLTVFEVILLAFIAALFIQAIFKILVSYGEKILIVRKRITSILWFFLIAIISLIVSGYDISNHSLLFMASCSLIISIGASLMKKIFWIDVYVTTLSLLILYKKYAVFL